MTFTLSLTWQQIDQPPRAVGQDHHLDNLMTFDILTSNNLQQTLEVNKILRSEISVSKFSKLPKLEL